jgi:predicted nucleic acid-binding protein
MSGSTKPPLLCWDSCIFLAWFKKEEDKPLAAIEACLNSIAANKTNLLISAVSFAEVLDKAGKSDAGTQFVAFAKRQNIIIANVDVRVALQAGTIREYGHQELDQGRISHGVSIPDAMIVATAMLYRADELQTFDPILLQVGQWPILHGLKIIRPDDSGRTVLGF